jgi:hypothetical protein
MLNLVCFKNPLFMTRIKITPRALFIAAFCLLCSCKSKTSMESADKSQLATSKHDFSNDPDLASVNAHTEEAQVKETQGAVLHWKHLLKLMGDNAFDTIGDSLYQDARHNTDPAVRLVSAKVALARNLRLINQLKMRFSSDIGLTIIGDYGANPLSNDSTAPALLREAYADVAIVKELQFSNEIDSMYAPVLARRIQQPKLPKLPPVPGIFRKLFGK